MSKRDKSGSYSGSECSYTGSSSSTQITKRVPPATPSPPSPMTKPVTRKHTEVGQGHQLEFAVCSMQGWRPTMEDAHIAEPEFEVSTGSAGLFAVFDGHGGADVALLCKEEVAARLKRSRDLERGDVERALRKTIEEIDADIVRKKFRISSGVGATALVAMVTDRSIHVAHVGDSRCVVGLRGKGFKALTEDHVPSNWREKRRIENAGGYVQEKRVNGSLAMSRAVGDADFKTNPRLPPAKQLVTATPDFTRFDRTKADFMILACDGIWEAMPSKAVVKFIRTRLKHKKALKAIAKELCDACLDVNGAVVPTGDGVGRDNMTVVIVKLLAKNASSPKPKKAKKKRRKGGTRTTVAVVKKKPQKRQLTSSSSSGSGSRSASGSSSKSSSPPSSGASVTSGDDLPLLDQTNGTGVTGTATATGVESRVMVRRRTAGSPAERALAMGPLSEFSQSGITDLTGPGATPDQGKARGDTNQRRNNRAFFATIFRKSNTGTGTGSFGTQDLADATASMSSMSSPPLGETTADQSHLSLLPFSDEVTATGFADDTTFGAGAKTPSGHGSPSRSPNSLSPRSPRSLSYGSPSLSPRAGLRKRQPGKQKKRRK